MDGVPGFDKADYSLRPVNLVQWEGLMFVTFAVSPLPAEKWFVPLACKFSRCSLLCLRSASRIGYDVLANLKLICLNCSASYQCLGVHPELSKISPHDSAENDLTEGPFLGGFMRIASDKSLTMSGDACALPVGDFGNEDFRFVFYYSIFPNMLLSLHPDYVM